MKSTHNGVLIQNSLFEIPFSVIIAVIPVHITPPRAWAIPIIFPGLQPLLDITPLRLKTECKLLYEINTTSISNDSVYLPLSLLCGYTGAFVLKIKIQTWSPT